MVALKDITGQRFGRLVVLSRAASVGTHAAWRCRCDCGAETVVIGKHLRSGHTTSCGCAAREVSATARVTHGAAGARGRAASPTYVSWCNMVQRCTNPRATGYGRYGGRGITVCERWRASFEAFLADVGERPAGTTLDRVDNAKGYEPGNVRWATRAAQNANRTNARRLTRSGETLSVAEWSRRTGIPKATILRRLAAGWSTSDVLSKRGSR